MDATNNATVSALSMLAMSITLLITFGLPIALAVWAKLKYKKDFSFIPLLCGAAAFFVSQIIIRIPLIQFLPMFGWYKAFMEMKWLYAAVLCFTAGLFEEPARFLVFSLLKKRRSFQDGLSYGIGHGGIEAVLLVGMTYINNLVYSVMINTGAMDKMIATLPATVQPQMQSAIANLTTLSPQIFLMGGVERALTMIVHIALTMIVLRGFVVHRKGLYLVLAILTHGLANFLPISVSMLTGGHNPWLTEGVIAVLAALGLWYIIRCARTWKKPEPLTEIITPEEPSL